MKNLYQTIKADVTKAIKAQNPELREILKYLVSLLQNEEIKLGSKFDDNAALVVLQREMKRKKESLEMFVKAKREDLIKEQEKEIEVLEEYLPKMLSEQELEKIVRDILGQSDSVNFGQIIGQVMAQVNGKADGKTVSSVVNRLINQKN